MNTLLPAAVLLLSLSVAHAQAEPANPIGPLAQSFYPAEDDDRPELFLPTPGDSDPSNFLPREGDSDPDNFESSDLDEIAPPARSPVGARVQADVRVKQGSIVGVERYSVEAGWLGQGKAGFAHYFPHRCRTFT